MLRNTSPEDHGTERSCIQDNSCLQHMHSIRTSESQSLMSLYRLRAQDWAARRRWLYLYPGELFTLVPDLAKVRLVQVHWYVLAAKHIH